MKVTVIGAGNIGTQFAIEFAEKENEVVLFCSDDKKINKELVMVDETGKVIKKAEIKLATSDICEAVKEAEYVIITYPAFMLKQLADKMYDYVRPGMKIGVIPGTGGAEFFFRRHVEKGAVFFGLQRVPAVARLKKYGETVCVTGKRDKLHIASMPVDYSDEIANCFSNVFEMSCDILPNYLTVTLTPSNPILHTTRLKTLFEDYVPGRVYEKNPLFYEEWSEKSSELLLECDEELQIICRKIEEKTGNNLRGGALLTASL